MKSEQQVKQDWQQRGFSFGIWVDPPGQVWKDFRHDCDELFMLVQGEIELIIADKTLRPKIGAEVLIPARQLHMVKNIGGTESRWYYGYASL